MTLKCHYALCYAYQASFEARHENLEEIDKNVAQKHYFLTA